MPARALYYSGRDRPAGRECLVVAQVLRVVGQVAHARLHAGSPVIGQPARIGLRGDRLGDMPGPAGQHRQRLDGHPVLSGRIIPGMEAPRGGPHVLLHVHKIDDEVDRRVPAAGLGLDQFDLVAVPVDQYYPGAHVVPVAGLGLAESGAAVLIAAGGGAQPGRAAGAAISADQPVPARDRRRAVRLAEHRQRAHPQHLRQARCPGPVLGRAARPELRLLAAAGRTQ
jgi:hypothetical protein